MIVVIVEKRIVTWSRALIILHLKIACVCIILLLTFPVRRLLARHPMVLERLRREIQSSCTGSEDFRREDLMKMSYLKNVIRESMLLIHIDLQIVC